MIIIDKISLTSIYILLKIISKNKNISVGVLEKNSKVFFICFSLIIKLFNIKVNFLDFYAGHSYTEKNENIWPKARHIMEEISFNISRNILKQISWINKLNNYWERNTILLFLTKHFFVNIEYNKQTITKYLIADMFVRKNSQKKRILIIERPMYFDESLLNYKNNFSEIIWYKKSSFRISQTKIYGFGIIFYNLFAAILNDLISKFSNRDKLDSNNYPKLLLTKEDELSLDRSLRSQPHWILKKIK